MDVPVLSVDEPMAESAVSSFGKIGVIATNPGTLAPSAALLYKTAEKKHKKIELTEVLCSNAYDALLEGNTELHDSIIIDELKKLMLSTDAVVLAQASMARVAGLLEQKDKKVPVLASPEEAVRYLAKVIDNL